MLGLIHWTEVYVRAGAVEVEMKVCGHVGNFCLVKQCLDVRWTV